MGCCCCLLSSPRSPQAVPPSWFVLPVTHVLVCAEVCAEECGVGERPTTTRTAAGAENEMEAARVCVGSNLPTGGGGVMSPTPDPPLSSRRVRIARPGLSHRDDRWVRGSRMACGARPPQGGGKTPGRKGSGRAARSNRRGVMSSRQTASSPLARPDRRCVSCVGSALFLCFALGGLCASGGTKKRH